MKVEFEIETKPEENVIERKVNSATDIFNLDEVQAIKNAIQDQQVKKLYWFITIHRIV